MERAADAETMRDGRSLSEKTQVEKMKFWLLVETVIIRLPICPLDKREGGFANAKQRNVRGEVATFGSLLNICKKEVAVKTCMVISDSRGMPGDQVQYSKTWPFLLSRLCPDVHIIDKCRRKTTTDRLVEEGGGGRDLLERYRPDIVIIQLGIVDCVPRLFSQKGLEQMLLNIFSDKGRRLYIKVIKRVRGRSSRRAYVNASKFSDNVRKYLDRCAGKNIRVVFVETAAGETYKVRNSSAMRKIQEYNQIFKEIASWYDFSSTFEPDDSQENFLEDGFHLSEIGHQRLAQSLREFLSQG